MNRIIDMIRSKSRRYIIISGLLLTLFIAFICGSVIVHADNTAAVKNEKLYFKSIVVSDGDTLWSIASDNVDYNHYSNIYTYMNEIIELNNIQSSTIIPGEKIIITYYE